MRGRKGARQGEYTPSCPYKDRVEWETRVGEWGGRLQKSEMSPELPCGDGIQLG